MKLNRSNEHRNSTSNTNSWSLFWVCVCVCFLMLLMRGLRTAPSMLTFHLAMPTPSTRVTNNNDASWSQTARNKTWLLFLTCQVHSYIFTTWDKRSHRMRIHRTQFWEEKKIKWSIVLANVTISLALWLKPETP